MTVAHRRGAQLAGGEVRPGEIQDHDRGQDHGAHDEPVGHPCGGAAGTRLASWVDGGGLVLRLWRDRSSLIAEVLGPW